MSKEIIDTWEVFFKNRGVGQELIDEYKLYIEGLLKNNVPIIFEFNHLSLLLGRTRPFLATAVNSTESLYREFKIPKRNGDYRVISAPYPSLLEIQNWIYDNILKNVPINSSAHGFVYKKSIVTNAKIHLGQKELLKLDLKDFFPSIKINRIISIFNHLGYNNKVSFYLASLCTLNDELPQGAPTSPMLSNIVAYRLDKRLISLAKKFDLKYTRYADDLTFSGKSIPPKYIEYINSIIEDEGFLMNKDKTRLYKTKSKRIVTGISIADGTLKVPREYKRKLKQELFFITKYGFESHIKKNKIRKLNYLESLLGKVNYWLMIEPKNETALNGRKVLLEYYKSLPTTHVFK